MITKFDNTADFDVRYEIFLKNLEDINHTYNSFFETKLDDKGNMDCIQMHLGIHRINDEGGYVRLSIFPRSYLPKEIKNETIKIFAAHFNPELSPTTQ